MYLNSQICLSILAIKSLIFRETFFPWNLLVNFRLKCDSHTKISDYFGSYLLALIKNILIKNLIKIQKFSFLRIWLNLLKKSLMENFFFCAVQNVRQKRWLLTLSYQKDFWCFQGVWRENSGMTWVKHVNFLVFSEIQLIHKYVAFKNLDIVTTSPNLTVVGCILCTFL